MVDTNAIREAVLNQSPMVRFAVVYVDEDENMETYHADLPEQYATADAARDRALKHAHKLESIVEINNRGQLENYNPAEILQN